MEQTADNGLLANSVSAASCNLSSSTSFMISGTGVDTGQFLLHWGTLHFKQRDAI
jgi:hypothetical protein